MAFNDNDVNSATEATRGHTGNSVSLDHENIETLLFCEKMAA